MTTVVDDKCAIINCCRESWPIFAKFQEDQDLKDPKWERKYKGKLVVMWDDTNISFSHQPGGAWEQRVTYNSYYGENCAKGVIFLQLCGWMGVAELWVGAISDSDYQEKCGILEMQQKFAEMDLVAGLVIAFLLIVDKGYRIIQAAWRAGRQEVVQPTFARSDEMFTDMETLISGSVAVDRSGNERAVRLVKLSGFLRRGLHQKGSPTRLNDMWLAWAFQCNFMFKAVH